MAQSFRFRRGTAAQWTAANPILAGGEPGFETDTGKWKIGDGTSTWAVLANPYVARGGDNTIPVGGLHLNLASPALAGYAMFLTTENRPKVIASTDFVLLHSHNVNNANQPRQWGFNPVIVKDIASAGAVGGNAEVIGIEVSVTNNTTEAATPQTNGQLTGLYLSYINNANQASAAISIGGLSAGWNHGLWVDGIKSTGIGIKLRDAVSAAGMSIGIDLSGVSSYSSAAILLGNSHRLRALTTTALVRDLIQINNVDEVVVGDSANNTPVRIYASALKLNTPTAATATAGTNGAPPAQVQGYFYVSNPFGDVKIPYYNV